MPKRGLLDAVNQATKHPDAPERSKFRTARPRPELDDILSTIKKMVEDHRPKERLVLTPSQMIAHNTTTEPDAKPTRIQIAESLPLASSAPDATNSELGQPKTGQISEELSGKIAALETLIARAEECLPTASISHSSPDQHGNEETLFGPALDEAPILENVEHYEEETLHQAQIHSFPDVEGLKIAVSPPENTLQPLQDQDASLTTHEDETPLSDEEMEMFRSVIAEVVRQELQGHLGERITRNVRKLVRREIHQALLTKPNK